MGQQFDPGAKRFEDTLVPKDGEIGQGAAAQPSGLAV